MNPEKSVSLQSKLSGFVSRRVGKLAEIACKAGLILTSKEYRYTFAKKLEVSSRYRRDEEELLLIMSVNNMNRTEALALKAQRAEESRLRCYPIKDFLLYDCLQVHHFQDRLSDWYWRWRHRSLVKELTPMKGHANERD